MRICHAFMTTRSVTHHIENRLRLPDDGCDVAHTVAGQRILAIENSPADLRAQVFRQGNGGNRASYVNVHAATRWQWAVRRSTSGCGSTTSGAPALPSTIEANPAFRRWYRG